MKKEYIMTKPEEALNKFEYRNIIFNSDVEIQKLKFDVEAEKNTQKHYFIILMNNFQNEAFETLANGYIDRNVYKLRKIKKECNSYNIGLIIPKHPIFYNYITSNEVYNDFEVLIYSENGEFINSDMLKKISI